MADSFISSEHKVHGFLASSPRDNHVCTFGRLLDIVEEAGLGLEAKSGVTPTSF